MEEGQELSFDIYGSTVKGKFISEGDNSIVISVTYDSLGVSKVGEKATINKDYLIK